MLSAVQDDKPCAACKAAYKERDTTTPKDWATDVDVTTRLLVTLGLAKLVVARTSWNSAASTSEKPPAD